MAGKVGENITVYTDYGAVIGKVGGTITVTEQTVLEKRIALEKATADLAEAEKRRALIVDELKAKQEAANPATAAAEAALGKYRKAVEEANAAQTKQREELDKLTPGTTDYGIAAGQAALADERLKQAKEVLTKAEADYNAEIQRTLRDLPQAVTAANEHSKAIEQGIKELEQGVAGAKKYADAIADVVDAETSGIRAEIALAKAKGDTATAQALAQQLAIQEAEGAIRVAKAKEAEQAMEYALAVAKRNQVAALAEKNQATSEDLALAELVVQKELAEAQAAGINTQAQEVLAQKLREVNQAKGGATQATESNTGVTEQNTQSTEKNAKATRDSIDILKSLVAQLDGARQAMKSLSDNTEIYFDLMLANELSVQGVSGAFEELQRQQIRFNAAIRDSDPELRTLREGLQSAELDVKRLQLELINSPNSFRTFELAVKKAQATATAAFNEQAIAATEMTRRFEEFAKAGGDSVGHIAVTMRELSEASYTARNNLNLLDQQRFDQLNSAIDAAKGKMEELRQASEEALAAAQQALLQEQGDTAGVLRLQQKQKELELQQRINEAKAAGDREALNNLQAALALEQKAYDLKIKKAEADAQSNNATAASTRTAASAGAASPERTFALNLTVGQQTLQATTTTDPSSFLNSVAAAKRSAL